MLKPFERIKLGKTESLEQVLERLQDKIEETFNQLVGKDFSDNVLLKDLKLEAAFENLVEHSLGRVAKGALVVRCEPMAVVEVKQTDGFHVKLITSLDCKIDLVVF